MAYLWAREKATGRWSAWRLETPALRLRGDPDEPLRRPRTDDAAGGTLLVRCAREGGAETWVLFDAGADRVAVNGEGIPTGMRVLRHRDELRLRGNAWRLYFSGEAGARIEPFPGAARPVLCPLCQTRIEANSLAVRCPGPACGVWFHQSEELPCWTRATRCKVCGQPTALESPCMWTPAEL